MKAFKKVLFITLFLNILVILPSSAQPKQPLIDVQITPLKLDWTYDVGKRVDFEIKIIKNGQLLPNVLVDYEIGLEQMIPIRTGSLNLKTGSKILKGVSIKNPGFIRCKATIKYNGKIYTGWGTAGVSPHKIKPTVKMPKDFHEFWETSKYELSKIPLDANVTLMPNLCTSKVNVYHVNLQNIKTANNWKGESRIYGMLSVPKKEGKYPVILAVPGAGVRNYRRDDRAEKGVIIFHIGIHGIPVNMEDEIYDALAVGGLSGYQNFNLQDKDAYYYKRVYMGCVRALDYIFTLPKFDGESLAVTGGSQGGALSIVTASLDNRVKYVAAFHPALSDLTGYLEGRAGGWPHMFKDYNKAQNPNWVTTTAYYDVVNFSRTLKIPGWYSWGFNDNVCPPTSMYAAYNSINSPKELHLALETAHWTFPEYHEAAFNWLLVKLGVNNNN